MTIQFELQDLMVFLLCTLGIAVTILMIPLLVNIAKVTSIVRSTMVKNQESIQRTLRSLPGILDNITQISNNSKEITVQIKTALPTIVKEVEGVTHAAKEGIESAGDVLEKMGSGINNSMASYKDTDGSTNEATGFMAYVPLIKEVLQVINNTFLSDK